jgi:hypothetical protein
MSERDPRIDPCPGDVLRNLQWRRDVLEVGPLHGYSRGVKYRRINEATGHGETVYCYTMAGWYRGTRGAEVLKRGEGE